jgi:hypothetical protein
MDIENRQWPRAEIRYMAWIEADDGLLMRDCIVRDISATGAKLGMVAFAPSAVPQEFTLLLSPDGQVRHRCRVAWRSDEKLGVKVLHAADFA